MLQDILQETAYVLSHLWEICLQCGNVPHDALEIGRQHGLHYNTRRHISHYPFPHISLSCYGVPLVFPAMEPHRRRRVVSIAAARMSAWQAADNTDLVLDLSWLGLDVLPPLPSQLRRLDCQYNELLQLPAHLPAALEELNCTGNLLTELPPLPLGLTRLRCSENALRSFPPLPVALVHLECADNCLEQLPSCLPPALEGLWCQFNDLAHMPPLPACLEYLYCQGNARLTRISTPLPAALLKLCCGFTAWPALPPLLEYLGCTGDVSLPPLPVSLRALYAPSARRLPDVPPPSLRVLDRQQFLPEDWAKRVRRQHATDRVACRRHLPSAAMLFL